MSSLAEKLFSTKDFRKLEIHFSNSLKNSTDISLFKVYLKYIKSQHNEVNLIPVYDFILKKLSHHWDIFYFIKPYIAFLRSAQISEDDRIEKMRSIFHASFLTPMVNFKSLWKEYETFEMDLNRTTGAKMISEVMPIYQKTSRLYLLYKNMYDYENECFQDKLSFDDYYEILEIEERNPAGYAKDHFVSRLQFLYGFFCERFEREETYFLWSEFLIKADRNKEAIDLIKTGMEKLEGNLFLSCYYALISDLNIYEDLIKKIISPSDSITAQNQNVDIILINYLSFELKKYGLEKFRSILKKYLTQEIGPGVFIFAAKTEFFFNQDKNITFRIYSKAIQKYPDHLPLQEEFIKFLLTIGDIINARAFYEKFTKTEDLTNLILFYESKYGNIADFRNTLQVDPVKGCNETYLGCFKRREMFYVQFKRNLEFYDLKFGNKDVLSLFVDCINSVKGLRYPSYDKSIVIDLLRRIKIEQ